MWGKSNSAITTLIFLLLCCSAFVTIHSSSMGSEPLFEPIARSTYSYHNYTTLVDDMETLNETYPSVFELYNAQSKFGLQNCKDGYKVWIIRITNEALGFNKPEVLFIGGHHGNEKVSIEAAYYFAEWLVTNYEDDEHVQYLIDHREIYIMPVLNPWGWENDVREDGNNEDPNRDYPYANTSFNTALSTVGARAVHEIMTRHLFINAITWHSGLEAIYYAWGTPVHNTPTDEAPDTVAFYEQARIMSAEGGNFNGKYQFGSANEIGLGVRGAWSDYAYAATWDTQYTAPEYLTNGSRALAIGVEISSAYTPPTASLGNSEGVYEPGGDNDGYIPKNIRMALVLTDTAQPYINWKNRDNIPGTAYPGQNITLAWEVMGAASVDQTQMLFDDEYDGVAVETIDKYQTPQQSGRSGWYDDTFTEQITMPEEPGDYYFVVTATVDQNTQSQTSPEPAVEPQSLYVNLRTNESWSISNNGNSLEGQKVWYSETIKIKVKQPGWMGTVRYPETAESQETIAINWWVFTDSRFNVNRSEIFWGNNPDPRNESEYLGEGEVVWAHIDNVAKILNYTANITMPVEPDNYYFIANVIIEHRSNQSLIYEFWSSVIMIEVLLPPGGFKLNVTTPVVQYIGNMTQQIDITGVSVTCPELYSEPLDDTLLEVHQFYIFNENNIVLKTGELSWNGHNWQAQDVKVSALPEDEYYVIGYFEHQYGNGSNVHINGDTSEFEVNHIFVINPPTLDYTEGKFRSLNITNVTLKSSYAIQPEINLTNVIRYEFVIENYTTHWKPVMTGELNWTGEHWQALNINLSSYGKGEYRAKCYFLTNYHSDDHTSEFNITYIDENGDISEDEVCCEDSEISSYYVILAIGTLITIILVIFILFKNRKKIN